MKPAGDLEQRLVGNIQRAIKGVNLYDIVRSPDAAIVRETAADGEATVTLVLPEGCLAIQWNLPTGVFRVLQEEVNADGAFIVRRADGSFEAHVVECKKALDRRDWSKARKQMRWTLSRLRGIAGVLGVELRRGVLYTAYRESSLSPESAPNPIAQRRPLGPRPPEPDAGVTPAWDERRAEREWVDDALSLTGFDGPFPHFKIKLDDQGRGSHPFACD